MNWHLTGLTVRVCFKRRCSATQSYRCCMTIPVPLLFGCTLLLYFLNIPGVTACLLRSNTKLNSSPLASLVFWYQQTDPHIPPKFYDGDTITFPSQPQVSGLRRIITWLCNTALRDFAVVSQAEGHRSCFFCRPSTGSEESFLRP